jgi:calcineurin-like phosphoesterase family protein
MTIFFTSDTHFGHQNIIDFCDRPWRTADEMNEALIERWNRLVGPNDTIYHLGDFAMKIRDDEIRAIVRRLNGHKILILGNHDERTIARKSSAFKGDDLFEAIYPGVHEVMIGKQRIVLCHYSMEAWNQQHRGSYHLYGHSHGTLPERSDRLSFDAGVDPNGYFPVSYDEVVERMEAKSFVPIDHHK